MKTCKTCEHHDHCCDVCLMDGEIRDIDTQACGSYEPEQTKNSCAACGLCEEKHDGEPV